MTARLEHAAPSSYADRRSRARADLDARGLEAKLRRSIAGDMRFDVGARALYATDASNYRQPPIGVALPRSTDDRVATLAACREYGAPQLSRGGGASLAGQRRNAAVILDFSRYMTHILEIGPERKVARVQPGVVLDDLRVAAEQHHLTFGPDPATHNRCTLGGMLGHDSCGAHSIMAGKTVDALKERGKGIQGVQGSALVEAGDYPERALANLYPPLRCSARIPMTLAAIAVAGGAAAVVAMFRPTPG